MKIAVIDGRDQTRASNIKRAVEEAGYPGCRQVNYVWGDDASARPSVWSDAARDSCRTLVVDTDLILLHINADYALPFAKDVCKGKGVIYYSGGSLSDGDIEHLREARQEYSKHCVFRNPVRTNIEETDWDLKACLDAIAAGRPDFCEQLHRFDPVLEAKLNLLYACLGGGKTLQDFRGTNDWGLVKDLKIAEQKEEGTVEQFISGGCPPEKLLILRNALLPD